MFILPEGAVSVPEAMVRLLKLATEVPATDDVPLNEIVPAEAVKVPLAVNAPTTLVVPVPAVKVTPEPPIVKPPFSDTAALPEFVQVAPALKVSNPVNVLVPAVFVNTIAPLVPFPTVVVPVTAITEATDVKVQ